MRKYILLLLIAILFIPGTALAATTNFVDLNNIDFSFFVENEKGQDIGDLEFKVKTVDGKELFSSQYYNYYQPFYYYVQSYNRNSSSFYNKSNYLEYFFSSSDINTIKNGDISTLGLNNETFKKYICSYGNCNDNGSITAYSKYVPLILEEVGSSDTHSLIKEVLYGKLYLVKVDSNSLVVMLSLENSPTYISTYSGYIYGTNFTLSNVNTYVVNNSDSYYNQLLNTNKFIKKYTTNFQESQYGSTSVSQSDDGSYLIRPVSDIAYATAETELERSHTQLVLRTTSMNPDEPTSADFGFISRNKMVFVKMQSANNGSLNIPDTLKTISIPLLILIVTLIGAGIVFINKNKNKKEINK